MSPEMLRRKADYWETRARVLPTWKAEQLRALARDARIRAAEREHLQDDSEPACRRSTIQRQNAAETGLTRGRSAKPGRRAA